MKTELDDLGLNNPRSKEEKQNCRSKIALISANFEQVICSPHSIALRVEEAHSTPTSRKIKISPG